MIAQFTIFFGSYAHNCRVKFIRGDFGMHNREEAR